MDASVLVAIVAAFAAMGSAYFTYRASAKATDVEGKKVDQAAYDRAIDFYQKQLDDATKQIDRVTAQMDRLNVQLEKVSSQLSSEQDVSNTLRNQVRALQSQVELLTGTLNDLRSRIGQRIDRPAAKDAKNP